MVCRLALLFLLSLKLHAQTFNAAPFLAMGNTGLAQTSLYSISNNPAGVALLDNIQAGAAYQNHFLSSDIQSQAMYLAIPITRGNAIAFGGNRYGLKEVSNVVILRGIYAKNFGHVFSCAVGLNYHHYYVRNYDNDQTLSLDLGFQYHVHEQLHIGALARNVSMSRYRDDILQYIPVEYGLGFCYALSDGLRFASDIYYNTETYFNYRGGLEYRIDAKVFLRGGMASHPAQYFGGIGLGLHKMKIDLASSFHPRLGSSPQLAVAYGF